MLEFWNSNIAEYRRFKKGSFIHSFKVRNLTPFTPNIPLFSPSRRIYEPEAGIPVFQHSMVFYFALRKPGR